MAAKIYLLMQLTHFKIASQTLRFSTHLCCMNYMLLFVSHLRMADLNDMFHAGLALSNSDSLNDIDPDSNEPH